MSTVQKVMDAVMTVGEYTNQQGEAKKEYLTVGSLFVYAEGGMSLKIKDGISITGNVSFYDRKPKENTGYGQGAPQQYQQPQQPTQQPVQQPAYQNQGQPQPAAYGQPQQTAPNGAPIIQYDVNGNPVPQA